MNLQKEKIKLMKERNPENKVVIDIINSILTGFKNKAVELKVAVEELSESDKLAVIKSTAKQLDQEIDGLISAGRDHVNQDKQKAFVSKLLPTKRSVEETKLAVEKAMKDGLTDMGSLMKHFKTQTEYDMKHVNVIVKDLLRK